MVEVKYMGRLGNRLFQYCLGRIIAESLGFRLNAGPISGFPGTQEPVPGKDFSNGPLQEFEGQKIDLQGVLGDHSPRRIVLHGYFQRYEYYQPFKETIRKRWLVPGFPVPPQRSLREIVLHVRRGDYVQLGWATPFHFYRDVLESATYERVFIVTDVPEDPFFRRFRRYQPVVFHKDTLEDFAMLLSFKRIVISQSSFAWWAAFLSEAEEVIVPASPTSPWSGNKKQFDGDMRINLEVFDERRFKTATVRGAYRPNVAEFVFNVRHYRAQLRQRWNFLVNRIAMRFH